MNVKVKIFYS